MSGCYGIVLIAVGIVMAAFLPLGLILVLTGIVILKIEDMGRKIYPKK